MPELIDSVIEIEIITEHLEVVANYYGTEELINGADTLMSCCRRLKQVSEELRKHGSAIPDYTSLPSFPKASDMSQGELTTTNCKTQNKQLQKSVVSS